VNTATTALPPVDDDTALPMTDRREPGRLRPLLVAAGVLVLLLIGAAAGLLVARAGNDSVPIPAADSVDVGFAQDMSVHHAQAAQMAAWERDHTTDPNLRQLSYDIETSQTAQIGRMQGWLELWGASAQPVGRPYMTWMAPDAMPGMAMGAAGMTTMPGMAGTQDLKNLRAATGKQLDVLFLQLMLRHHEGGSAMLADAARHATEPQVRNLAAQMLSTQTSEAGYMKQLLAQRGAAPLPT
jgi:uncharacterized protein (DUF305 family)